MDEQTSFDSLVSSISAGINGAVSVGQSVNDAVSEAQGWGSLLSQPSAAPKPSPNASGAAAAPSKLKSLVSGGAGLVVGALAFGILAILALRR